MGAARPWLWAGLVSYAGLLILGGIISVIPGAGQFVWETFLALLGDVPVFSVAAELLSSYSNIFTSPDTMKAAMTPELILAVLLRFASEALLSTVIIGACVRISTEATTRVTWRRGMYSIAETRTVRFTVFPLIIGTAVGILITKAIASMAQSRPDIQAMLYASVSIVLILLGLKMMLGHKNKRTTFHDFLEDRAKEFLKGLSHGMLAATLFALAATSLVLALCYSLFTGTFWCLMLLHVVSIFAAIIMAQL